MGSGNLDLVGTQIQSTGASVIDQI
jgi:hypothetical protein